MQNQFREQRIGDAIMHPRFLYLGEVVMLEWKIVTDEYLDYLRTYEVRIPKTDYGTNRMKPFFGVLFETDDMYYVTQVSSPKPRHERIRPDVDFMKFKDENDNLLFVVNLNYMFPVPKNQIRNLVPNDILAIKSGQDAGDYIALLRKEMTLLRNSSVEKKALRVYDLKHNYPKSLIAQRCFDFDELEKLCKLFGKNNIE